MSKYIKVKYEGKLQAINNLIESKDWKIELKEPDEGILYMKIKEDIEEEVSFFKNIIFDEETGTKFGEFEPITEEEFDSAINLAHSVDLNEENESKKVEEVKVNKVVEQENTPKKSMFEEFKKSLSNDQSNSSTLKQSKTFQPKIQQPMPSINLTEIVNQIISQYKDPYDYFFSQSYLVKLFMCSVILLIVLNW